MDNPEERVTAFLTEQNITQAIGFLEIELYEIVGGAMTILRWLQHQHVLSPDINQPINDAATMLRDALEYIKLFYLIRTAIGGDPDE
jgi:hypothetical protein